MYELHPYFTNDGTVGLFSRRDDDIYHSTYGALTESWQKFIIPSGLEKYIKTHNEVKILDICYGIGYNSKTALNVFIKNALELEKNAKMSSKQKKCEQIKNTDLINSELTTDAIVAIHADNISQEDSYEVFKKNNYSASQNNVDDVQHLLAIYADNLLMKKYSENNANCEKLTQVESINNWSESCVGSNCRRILLDAVDLDKFLIDISPFITDASRFNFVFENKIDNVLSSRDNKMKYKQIKNIQSDRQLIKKELRLKKEVSIILLYKLLKQNPSLLKDKILQSILSQKKYSPFFSKFMINLAQIYTNNGSHNKEKQNKSTFLHNIYYKYLSASYKRAQSLVKNFDIDITFHKNDARRFIKTTNNKYNFIFLDAFTPSKCPALWSLQFFKELYSKLEDDGKILTYSSSAAIRNALLQNGFYVGKIYDINSKKFVGTVASKKEDLIEHELNERDIDLINSKAGICFRDNENLELDNSAIIENREHEVRQSELTSSSQVLKGYKNAHAESL